VKNILIVCVSFVIGFCLANVASAQARIAPPENSTPACLARFNELYDDGSIDLDDAASLTNWCVDSDRTMISFYENLYDSLNGPGGRPSFATMDEAREAFTMCREVEVCPRDPETPTVAETPRTPRALILEGHGPHRIEGRGWRRQVVCEDGTTGVVVEERYSRREDEARRRIPTRTTLRIVWCIDITNPSAIRVAETRGEVDLTDILRRLDHLENACGEDGMREQSSQWRELCTRFDAVLIHTTEINTLRTSLGTLRDDLDALSAREDARWAADCGQTNEEWAALTEGARLELIRSGQCDGASTTVVNQSDWHLRFHLGAGLHLLGVSAPATLIAPYGVVYAELEALPSDHFGFYLRGFIGAGDLLDRVGQWNPDGTIGASGVFGGSAGATFRLDEIVAFDLGVATSSVFNPGGQIGSSLHTWPIYNLGGEFRVRINPVRWFHIEATVGLDYTHSEVRRPNVDHFVGVDALGGHGSLGVGFSF